MMLQSSLPVKKNAFDLLRLILAFCVVITHSYLVGGYKTPDCLFIFSKGQTTFGEIGVMGFFALSGYLITGSFERTRNILAFAGHRILRIFPGFWVCLIITGFVIAPLIFVMNGGGFKDFIFTGGNSSLTYFISNIYLKINQWSIRDILLAAAYKDSINGSLWSLFPELQCYFLTIILGFFGLFNKNKMIYLVVYASVLAFFALNHDPVANYGPTILILSSAFKLYVSYLSGSILYVYKDQFRPDAKGVAFVFLFLLVLIKFGGFNLISPLLVAIALIKGFQLFEVKLKYDVSYGLYIYSFPVQQLLFIFIGNKLPIVFFILLAFVIAGLLGLLSYTFIERPAISLKKRVDTSFGFAQNKYFD